jgi:hypothetical protein
MMKTLSKIALAIWGIFLVFVLSVLLVSSMPIYWLWVAFGVVVCALLARGLRTQRGLVLINAGAAVVFLATFSLYWIAIAATLYGDAPAGAALGNRFENMLYVIVGNFQQGQIWRGLQSAYIQLFMPLSQVALLVIALALAKRSGTGKAVS